MNSDPDTQTIEERYDDAFTCNDDGEPEQYEYDYSDDQPLSAN